MINRYWTHSQEADIQKLMKLHSFPCQVEQEILSVIGVMDGNYGYDRKITDDGGFVAIIIPDKISNTRESYQKILGEFNLKPDEWEYRNKICCDNNNEYFSDLYLAGTEYAIVIIWYEKIK